MKDRELMALDNWKAHNTIAVGDIAMKEFGEIGKGLMELGWMARVGLSSSWLDLQGVASSVARSGLVC